MKTSEAVALVLKDKALSKYALAKQLNMSSATSVNQWLRGTRMRKDTADKFEQLYNIKISDSYEAVRASIRIS